MNTKYIRVLAMVLAMLFIASGCSLISISSQVATSTTAAPAEESADDDAANAADAESEYDDNTVVAEYDGGTILRGDAMSEYEDVVAYYESYGYTLDDEATVQAIKEDILSYLCENEIVMAKAEELGLTTVTDEERAELEEQANQEFEEVVEYYSMFFEGESEAQTRLDVIEYLSEQGYTLESAVESMIEYAWQDKLLDYICADLTVDEEAIREQYDELVAADEEAYSEDLYSFEYAATSGELIAWYPEGYRSVKHILIPFTSEQVDALSEKQMECEDVSYYIEELDWEAELAAEEEAADEEIEDELILESDGEADVSDEELVGEPEPEDLEDEEFDDSELYFEYEDESGYGDMTREQLVAELARLNEELEQMQAEYYQTVEETVNEVLAKINAGEDFEALIAEYGADDGMTVEPGLSMGYPISAQSEMFETAFTQAAMALTEVGEVSQPVVGTNGVHIIKYMSDITPGPVSYEDLRDSVEESALEVARENMYYETVAVWVEEANVVTYPERMN
ncbi:MAG: peptidylprolyl isomerase [Clostridia bacterium]|nr:peptidylprolyl isomerase [Clostridia bacterium]